MIEMIRRIFRPAPAAPARRRIIVRSNLGEAERAKLWAWAAKYGIKRQTDLERRAGETLAGMEKSIGKWGK